MAMHLLLSKSENFLKTRNKSIFIVKPKVESHQKLSKMIANLINLAKERKIEECYKVMSIIVSEYKKNKVENLNRSLNEKAMMKRPATLEKYLRFVKQGKKSEGDRKFHFSDNPEELLPQHN